MCKWALVHLTIVGPWFDRPVRTKEGVNIKSATPSIGSMGSAYYSKIKWSLIQWVNYGVEKLKCMFKEQHVCWATSCLPTQPIHLVCLVTKTRKHEHITPILNSLNWLPVVNRIKFKILLLVFKIKHGFAPTYLSDLLQPMIPSRSLRSSKHAHLQYTPGPRINTRYGDRAFSVAAPKLWNSLPITIRNATSIECFKSNLKRFLFNSPNWFIILAFF